LHYFTTLAPRILCKVRNGLPIKINNKENSVYIITVKNPSNKTIHELTVFINTQSPQTDLKSKDVTITKGLKFDSSIKDNILEVSIPFLSKGDAFSVKVYVENKSTVHNKPIIVVRSPENFKEIDSIEQKGILWLLFNIPKNIKQAFSKAPGTDKTLNNANREIFPVNNKLSTNKSAMIIIVSIVLVVIVGVFASFYFKGTSTNGATNTSKQSTGSKGSAGVANGTSDTNGSTESTNGTSGTNSSTQSTDGTSNSKGSTPSTNAPSNSKGSTESTNATTNTNESTQPTNTNTNTTTSPKSTNTTASPGSTNTNTTTPATGTNGTTGK
jgi:hypothetical protein